MTLITRLLFLFSLGLLVLGGYMEPSFAQEPFDQSHTQKERTTPSRPSGKASYACPSGQKSCEGVGCCTAKQQCCKEIGCCDLNQTCCEFSKTGCCSGGQVCLQDGCHCPPGEKLCNGECVSETRCCTADDCPKGELCQPNGDCTQCGEGQQAVYLEPTSQSPKGYGAACCPNGYQMVCNNDCCKTKVLNQPYCSTDPLHQQCGGILPSSPSGR